MMTPSTDIERRAPEWTEPSIPTRITTPDEYIAIAGAMQEAKGYAKRVVEFFKPLKQKAKAAWDALVEKEKESLLPVVAFENHCKQEMARWDTEQERLRLEEQRRLEAIARREEEERRLAEAAALEAEAKASGDTALAEQAERLLEEPVETPVVAVEKATPKVEGISYRETWSAVVTDMRQFVRHVAEHPELVELLKPNSTALNNQARSLKANLRIPGVKAVMKKVVSSR